MKLSSPPPAIHLDQLPQLETVFSALTSGRHINRLSDPVLWAALEKEAAQYEALFAALGYTLSIDARGFAWFQTAEASSSVSKATRQIALLFLVLFEHQADAGKPLIRFFEWRIDRGLLSALLEKNRHLLEAEGIHDDEALRTVVETAVRYGFVQPDGAAWQLLPAVFRYLDKFEDLAVRNAEIRTSTEVDESVDESVDVFDEQDEF